MDNQPQQKNYKERTMIELNRSSKTKKRKAFISIALVLALAITGALAFLTARDSAENKFTVGNVDIELTEPNWDENNAKNIVSGQIIAKDPTITNTGRNDAYVYMMVEIPKAIETDIVSTDESGNEVTTTKSNYPLFSFAANEGWTPIDSQTGTDIDAYDYYLYGYNTALTPGNAATLFNEVAFANVTSDFVDTYAGENNDLSLDINVTGYAIQSDYYNNEATDATTAWRLYVNQNDWTWPDKKYAGLSTLSFVSEDGDVVNTETAYAGTPVEMYFEPSLAKDGYTFDWVDETTNEVAYSGMPMPEEDTTLTATYTETGYGAEASDFIEYVLCSDSSGTISAVVAGLDETHENYPTSNFSLVIPTQINVTISDTGAVSLSHGTYTGNVSPHLNGKTNLLTRVDDFLSVLGEGTHTLPVMYIRDYAFLGNTNVENLVIPDSVKTIGRYLFCKDPTSEPPVLNSVVLAYGTREIQNSFYRCTSLSEINKIPSSVTEIGSNAFQETNIESITIPSSVITIQQRAFANCSNLTSLSLPSTLKTIGTGLVYNTPLYSNSENWYNNCLYIDNYLLAKQTTNSAVTIKSTTLCIAENVLSKASNITLEEGCNYILDENGVLYNKDMTQLIYAPASLTTYTIPHTVTEIYGYAFYDCSSLTDIYYIGTEEEWNSVAIGRNNTNLTSATLHYN